MGGYTYGIINTINVQKASAFCPDVFIEPIKEASR